MFGEESIYGQSLVHFDSKKRIFLPGFTLVEPKETLLIVNNVDFLSVYKEETFEKYIKEIEKQYLTYDLSKKRECDLLLLKFYSSILKKVQTDNQKRINLGGIETEKEEFLLIGAKDHVMLDTKCTKIK